MSIIYMVNGKTRRVTMLSNPTATDVAHAQEQGFEDVGKEAFDTFRAITEQAIAEGWKPDGRVSYRKFMARRAETGVGAQP